MMFLTWIKKRQRIETNDAQVRVNLGSGLSVAPGWIHIDGSLNALVSRWPSIVLNRLYDWSDNRRWYSREQYIRILKDHRFVHHRLEYGLPFGDETVDVIYSSHALEHMFREEAEALLRDARRALKPGGLIRIAVPDVEYACQLFHQGAKEQALEYFFSRSRSGYLNHHHYMYDFDLLKTLLETAGFRQVERRAFREGNVPDLNVLDNRPDETLFVEARK
jgi:predicted SAM-dependent methyltransferase